MEGGMFSCKAGGWVLTPVAEPDFSSSKTYGFARVIPVLKGDDRSGTSEFAHSCTTHGGDLRIYFTLRWNSPAPRPEVLTPEEEFAFWAFLLWQVERSGLDAFTVSDTYYPLK